MTMNKLEEYQVLAIAKVRKFHKEILLALHCTMKCKLFLWLNLHFLDARAEIGNFSFCFGRIEDTTIAFWNFLIFKGVMSYDQHCSVIPVSWSSCSRTDFINQYNAHKNRWCMAAKTSNFCGKFNKENLIDHSLMFSYIWIKKCNWMFLPHCKICTYIKHV